MKKNTSAIPGIFLILLGIFCFHETAKATEEPPVIYSSALTDSDIPKTPVIFSHTPGFYTDPFLLELSHADPGVAVYYTLDGSLPDTSAIKYSGPVLIEARSDYDNNLSMIPTSDQWIPPAVKVAKATIIRAAAFESGSTASPVSSATYFVFPEGVEKYSMAVISLITLEDYFFCDSIGIYVNRNYLNSGMEWEREASLEFFSPDITFQQDVGVRIHGGNNGRKLSQKSLRLYARSEYGESRFNYPIFPDLPYRKYNRLILRNSGNDWASTLFRDAAVQSIFKHLNPDTQAYRPAIVYINGEYWGIHNIRERYDKHYLGRVYDVDPENVDLLAFEVQTTDEVIIREGDAVHYDATIEFMKSNDLSKTEHYNHIKTLIDTENFTDYQIAQIFANNIDWPGNNNNFWRLKTDAFNPNGRHGHDGRWRWLIFDTDVGFGFVSNNQAHNALAFATMEGRTGWPNPDWATFMLRTLLTNEEFRLNFINRFVDLLNSAFLPERTTEIINMMKSVLEPEISDHIMRWNSPRTVDMWENYIVEMIRFAIERPSYQRDHIREYFGLGEDVTITVSTENQDHGFIRVNTLDILPSTPGIPEEPYPWKGVYFQGVPVRIEAMPANGYRFSHWTGSASYSESILKITPEEDFTLVANFVKIKELPVIAYWFFGRDLPNNTPLGSIKPLYGKFDNTLLTYSSSLEGYPFNPEHEYWRKASLERRNAPTDINYIQDMNDDIPYNDSEMRGIQVKQPFATDSRENIMIFHLPTTGYEDIEFRFAAMDEGAAESLIIDYSTTGDVPEWTDAELEINTLALTTAYKFYLLDFSFLEEAGNNPDFRIRLRFDGIDLLADDWNRVTFNNFSLHGNLSATGNMKNPSPGIPGIRVFPNPATNNLHVEFGSEIFDVANISLICTNGRIVAEKTIYPGKANETLLSLDGILPGVYHVIIRSGQTMVTRRIVIL
jgi:hypothetical protein